jgi:uncharacterized membrane protein YfcA
MNGIEAAPLALLIGLSLGAVGGGGSVLTVPVLVYLVGEGARQATSTSLLVVGLAAAAGALQHWRAGRVDVRAGTLVGICGVAGAVAGSWLGAHVPGRALLLSFAALTAVVAVTLFARRASGATADAATGRRRMGRVIVAGTVIGVLTGFFGVGGGFIVVPALIFALGFPLPLAVGTSLLVIAMNSAVALTTRLATTGVDWRVAMPFAATSLVGVLGGTALAGRVDVRVLTRALAFLLLGVAVFVGARTLAT